MQDDLLYQIALTTIPQIGPVQARLLIQSFGGAAPIFQARRQVLEKIEGIGSIRAGNIKRFREFDLVEKEIRFIEKYHIRPLFFTDPEFPQRLLHCYDPPVLLYYKGLPDLNESRIVAVIGTRNNSEYGRQATEKFIRELSAANVVIVSGLAYGIDAIAHRAALQSGLATIGVLAHGLDTIYPAQHHALAKEMLEQGGLLTEFPSCTKPDRHHFPMRNRIVAGLCDAAVVMETGVKGGSIITADLANSYHKDVFALPGRTTDTRSAGCNYLIRSNRAFLLADAQQFLETVGWEPKRRAKSPLQRQLFVNLGEEEKIVVEILRVKEQVGIDELNGHSNLSSSKVAAALLNLELQGIVSALPGKMYRLN